jgi:hypothetical protein
MPRAALLSIHARVEGAEPTSWEDPSLAQLWGPGYHAYVVAKRDVAIFTLGRLPEDPARLRLANDLADRLDTFMEGRQMTYGEAGRSLGVHHNALRYAAPTGRVLMRWDGARQPIIWTVPPPEVDPGEARLELARRYIHVFAPGTPESFAAWAGIRPRQAGHAAFESLRDSLTPVRTPMSVGWILTHDESAFRVATGPEAPARLLPSGDNYFLLYGDDRAVLVPEAERRQALWTPRVWPGAVLVEGEVVGVWRRSQEKVTVQTWRRLSPPERAALEAEAGSLPLPGSGDVTVRWED